MPNRRFLQTRPSAWLGKTYRNEAWRAGKHLCAATALATIASALPAHASTPASWTSAVSGSWVDASKWSTNPYYPSNGNPSGVTYAATINATGAAYSISMGNTNIALNSLLLDSSDATLNAGNLTVTGLLDAEAGTLNINGELTGGAIAQGAGATINWQGGTLNGVSLNSDLDITGPGAQMTIENGLGLDGHQLTLEVGTNLYFPDGSGFTGGGTILVAARSNSSNVSSTISAAEGQTLTIPSNVTIESGPAGTNASNAIYIGAGPTGSIGQSVLQGNIIAQAPGVPVIIKGNWTNLGTLTVNQGILQLDGAFKTSDIGTIVRNGGSLEIGGTLDNTNATLALSPATGDIEFGPIGPSGAAITGGLITSSGGASLQVPTDGNTTLSSLMLSAPVSVGLDGTLRATGTLNLNDATLTFDGGSGINGQGATWDVTGATISGTGVTIFNGAAQPSEIRASNTSSVTTIGPGITLEVGTGGAVVSVGNGGMNFQGTVITGAGKETISFSQNVNFTGSVVVLAGGTFTAPSVGNFAAGTLSGSSYVVNAGATLRLPGANIITDAANIHLIGAGAAIYSSATLNANALAGLNTITSLGSLVLNSGANLSVAGSLTDAGLLRVGTESSLTVPGGLEITGTGIFQGGGTIVGNVSLDSDPALTVVNIRSVTDYDSTIVTGNLLLGGDLLVSLAAGEAQELHPDDVFDILTATNLSGSFLNAIDGQRIATADGSGSFEILYEDTAYPDSVVLKDFVPTPEPALALSMLPMLIFISRARVKISSALKPVYD